MGLVYSNFVNVAGIYQFDNDPSAGVVGAVNLGVHIPKNAIIYRGWATCLQAFAGGAGSTLAFGLITTGVAMPSLTHDAFINDTGIANFNDNVPYRSDNITFYAPLKITTSCDLTMTIGTDPITAGQMFFNLWYTTMDF